MDGDLTQVASVQDFAGLAPGKHLAVRITLAGAVAAESVRIVSKRLLFFSLAYGEQTIQECLVKWRDGCFEEDEIAALVGHLANPAADGAGAPPTALSIHAFPEVGEDGQLASLHVIRATLPALAVHVPTTPREPVADRAPTRTALYKTAGTHKRPNTESRHQQFVAWLIDTYGIDALKAGSGVLDVAGGSGGVAFELAFRRGVPCVVVDPRPMQLNARQRRAIRNRVSSQAALSAQPPPNASWWLSASSAAPASASSADSNASAASSASASCGSSAAATSASNAGEPVAASSTAALCEEAAHEGEEVAPCQAVSGEAVALCEEVCEEAAAEEAERAPPQPSIPTSYVAAWADEGLPLGCVPRQVVGLFDEGFASGPYAHLWASCSVVVGMHPDQATEPIVRLALACDLSALAFEGRNTVVYSAGSVVGPSG